MNLLGIGLPIGVGLAALGSGLGLGRAVGGAMATRSATRLASEQLRGADAAGTAPQSPIGRTLYIPSRTIGNLGKEAAADIGTRLGGRMAKWSQSMDAERQSLKGRRRANPERRMRAEPSEDPKGSGGRNS